MKSKIIGLKFAYFLKAFLLSLILVILNISFNYLTIKFSESKVTHKHNFDSIHSEFVMVVFIAPIIETIIFQYLIINQVYISYNGKNNKIIAIIISSITFGLIHLYNLNYFIFGTIIGVLLASSFYYFKEKTNNFNAIFYVFLIHSLSNLYVFLIKSFNLL
jgi:membrane protease YdiL (CAAX protease family)